MCAALGEQLFVSVSTLESTELVWKRSPSTGSLQSPVIVARVDAVLAGKERLTWTVSQLGERSKSLRVVGERQNKLVFLDVDLDQHKYFCSGEKNGPELCLERDGKDLVLHIIGFYWNDVSTSGGAREGRRSGRSITIAHSTTSTTGGGAGASEVASSTIWHSTTLLSSASAFTNGRQTIFSLSNRTNEAEAYDPCRGKTCSDVASSSCFAGHCYPELTNNFTTGAATAKTEWQFILDLVTKASAGEITSNIPQGEKAMTSKNLIIRDVWCVNVSPEEADSSSTTSTPVCVRLHAPPTTPLDGAQHLSTPTTTQCIFVYSVGNDDTLFASGVEGVEVLGGFYVYRRAALVMKALVMMKQFQDLVEESRRNCPRGLFLTGHGMGGALATFHRLLFGVGRVVGFSVPALFPPYSVPFTKNLGDYFFLTTDARRSLPVGFQHADGMAQHSLCDEEDSISASSAVQSVAATTPSTESFSLIKNTHKTTSAVGSSSKAMFDCSTHSILSYKKLVSATVTLNSGQQCASGEHHEQSSGTMDRCLKKLCGGSASGEDVEKCALGMEALRAWMELGQEQNEVVGMLSSLPEFVGQNSLIKAAGSAVVDEDGNVITLNMPGLPVLTMEFDAREGVDAGRGSMEIGFRIGAEPADG